MGELMFLPSRERRVSRQELAAMFGVSTRTVDRWRALGLPCDQALPRGRVGYVPSRVETWLQWRRDVG